MIHAPLSEPVVIQDIFVSALAQIEDLGEGIMRFTFTARQKSIHDYAGVVENVVVARLIMPVGAALGGTKETMKALGYSCCGGAKRVTN